jgi:signal transduction histidine kinase
VQEALSNVRRHSGVQEAWVRLMYKSDALVLEVEDQGKGISPRADRFAVTRENDEHGIGLVAMRERAELIEGRIEYLQSNGRGTLVRLSAPREKLEKAEKVESHVG